MNMKKAVIFDMDGVLVDSEPVIIKASMLSLAENGIYVQYNDFKQFTGMGDDIFIGGVAKKYGFEYDVKYKHRAYEIYLDIVKDNINLYPNAAKLVEKLHNNDMIIAIASASDLIKVTANLKCLGTPVSWYKSIITGSDVTRKKPFPDIYLKAAESIKTEPKDCLVVEDALSGVQAAKSAGMTCIAVTTSFSQEQLSEAGADFVVQDIYDVLDYIK